MSYVGNTNTTQGFTPAVDYFSGNGSTVAFTLSRPVASVAQVQANISNVPQNPSSAFSVSGNTITFTSAPPSGTNNIYVYYTSPITQVIAPGQGTVTSSSFGTITDFTTTGNTVLGDASTDTLNVGNGGLVKDASGNVGIGTSSPSYKLDVSGNVSWLPGVTGAPRGYLSGASADQSIEVGSSTNSPFGIATNAVRRMTIDSSGNVGIGTSSPLAKFEVRAGRSYFQANSEAYSIYMSYASGTAGFFIGSPSADAMSFSSSGGGERMRIDSSGNLLVGQLTGNYVISAAATAYNGAKITNLVMGRSGGEYGSVGYGVRYTGTNSSYTYDQSDTASMIRFNNGKVETFTAPIGTAGNAISFTTGPYVAQGGASWTNSSDERLKDIIEPITGATNKVGQLRAVIGKFKTDSEDKRRSFLIAQDVQAVFPEAVDVSDPESLGVQYTDIIPLLVAAIKEQQAIIQTLTDRITALENK